MNGDISNGAHDIITADGQVIDSGGGETHFNGAYTFDGSEYDTLMYSDDWNFYAADFAIGFWFRPVNSNDYEIFLAHWVNAGNEGWRIYKTDSVASPANALRFHYSIDGTADTLFDASGISWDTDMHYFACARDDATFRMYLDGTQVGGDFDISTDSIYASTTNLTIGASSDGSRQMEGSLDEPLIVKGSNNGWTGSTIEVPTQTY